MTLKTYISYCFTLFIAVSLHYLFCLILFFFLLFNSQCSFSVSLLRFSHFQLCAHRRRHHYSRYHLCFYLNWFQRKHMQIPPSHLVISISHLFSRFAASYWRLSLPAKHTYRNTHMLFKRINKHAGEVYLQQIIFVFVSNILSNMTQYIVYRKRVIHQYW